MTVHNFKYYLHDNYGVSETEETLFEQGLPNWVATTIAEMRPFYEVTFDMEYDDETKELKVVGVQL